MQWNYAALDGTGTERQGHIEARDLADARAQLRRQGLRLLRLDSAASGGKGMAGGLAMLREQLRAQLPVRDADRVQCYRQMRLMLRAGYTVRDALTTAAALAHRSALADALRRCAQRIVDGASLSAAMAAEGTRFPSLTARLIQAGEHSGELDQVFERLADDTERRMEVRRQLLAALLYPTVVTLAAAAVVGFLVLHVVPRFAMFLTGRGRALPWAARTLMDIADWFARFGAPLLLALLMTVALLLVLRLLLPRVRLAADRLMLRLPLFGGTLAAAGMAQSAWALGLLIRSRLTVLESLRACASMTNNRAYEHAFGNAAQAVLAGRSLERALDDHSLPLLFRQMVAVGEKSGALDEVMEQLGQFYQKDLEARVKLLSGAIEPALTLVIGGVVGFVYFAFFQAMLTVSTGGG